MADETTKQKPRPGKRGIDWAKWIKRALAVIFVGAVVAGLVVSFQPKPIISDMRAVERGAMEVTVDEDGRTRVIDRYVVSAPLMGNVGRIELREGDVVEAGDVVARIEPLATPLLDSRSRAETTARLQAAEAAVRQAKATSKRAQVAKGFADDQLVEIRGLHKKGSISRHELELAELDAQTRAQELASAKFGERVAKGEVDMARAALRRLDGKEDEGGNVFEVIAPVDGRVLKVVQRSEGVVTAGTPLLEIADADNLEIVADVLTTDAVKILPGARVYVEAWGGESTLAGKVRRVEPSAFTRVSALGVEEQRVNVLIDLLDDPESRRALGDGYRVEVRIVVWKGDDVVIAPVSALFRQGDGWATFVVEDQHARLRTVEVGQRHGLLAEVTGGLAPGEQVIVHPDDAVADGVLVAGKSGETVAER